MAIPRVPDFNPGVVSTSKLSALGAATQYGINPTGCAVNLVVAQSITSASVPLVTYDTKVFDSASQFTAPGTTISISEAGLYMVGSYGSWQSNAAGYRLIQVEVNGSTVTQAIDAPANGNATSHTCVGVLTLAAGDAVATRITQNSGATLTYSGRMWAVRMTGT